MIDTNMITDLPKEQHIFFRVAGKDPMNCKKCGKAIFSGIAPGFWRGLYCDDCYKNWQEPTNAELAAEMRMWREQN